MRLRLANLRGDRVVTIVENPRKRHRPFGGNAASWCCSQSWCARGYRSAAERCRNVPSPCLPPVRGLPRGLAAANISGRRLATAAGPSKEVRMPVFGKSGIRALQQQAMLDGSPNYSTEVLTHHVRGLWHHVGLLEHEAGFAGSPQDEVILQVGSASITLKKDGTIIIK